MSLNSAKVYCEICKKNVLTTQTEQGQPICQNCGFMFHHKFIYKHTHLTGGNGSNIIISNPSLVKMITTNSITPYKAGENKSIISYIEANYKSRISEVQIVEIKNVLNIIRAQKLNLFRQHNNILAAYLYFITQFNPAYIDVKRLLYYDSDISVKFNLAQSYNKALNNEIVKHKKQARMKIIFELALNETNLPFAKYDIKLLHAFKRTNAKIEAATNKKDKDEQIAKLKLIKKMYTKQWLLPQK